MDHLIKKYQVYAKDVVVFLVSFGGNQKKPNHQTCGQPDFHIYTLIIQFGFSNIYQNENPN